MSQGRKAVSRSQKGSCYPEESGGAYKSPAFKGRQKYAYGILEDLFTLKVFPKKNRNTVTLKCESFQVFIFLKMSKILITQFEVIV